MMRKPERPDTQTILYGPCMTLGHTDCTAVISWHLGAPRIHETAMKFDIDMDDSKAGRITYRLTAKQKAGV